MMPGYDFRLAKTTLCVKEPRLYTEIWNDQPPLHTYLVAQGLKHLSPSVLVPRLLTVAFAALLLASLFLIAQRSGGAGVGALAAILLKTSSCFRSRWHLPSSPWIC